MQGRVILPDMCLMRVSITFSDLGVGSFVSQKIWRFWHPHQCHLHKGQKDDSRVPWGWLEKMLGGHSWSRPRCYYLWGWWSPLVHHPLVEWWSLCSNGRRAPDKGPRARPFCHSLLWMLLLGGCPFLNSLPKLYIEIFLPVASMPTRQAINLAKTQDSTRKEGTWKALTEWVHWA